MPLSENPNLALIPSGYKSGKIYSVLPTSGVGDFDFSRSGTATRINSQGLIETVADGVSRLNYPLIDGKVVGCPSHLLEPARTNLVTYSEDFTNAAWVKYGVGVGITPIVTPNYAISPDGTQNASRLQCDLNGGNTTSDRSWLYQTTTTISGDNTFSLYVKNNSNEEITFTLSNGSSETVVVLSDDKWHRLSTVKSGGGQPRIGLIGGVGASDNADLLIYGAQLEQGSYPTSYIKSNGSQTTRSAETANNSGDASTFNDSEGVLMAEISALDETGRIALNDGTTSNNVRFVYNSSTNVIEAVLFNGTNQASLSYSFPIKGAFNKIAFKYKENDFALWVDGIEVGSQVGSGTTFTSGTLSEIDFDAGSNGLVPFYGSAKQIQYFDSALTDSELETLTSWVSFTDMAEGQLYTIE